jgi:hypothetical protein
VVAIAGNAVENVVGVQAALRNDVDLAISLILNSSLRRLASRRSSSSSRSSSGAARYLVLSPSRRRPRDIGVFGRSSSSTASRPGSGLARSASMRSSPRASGRGPIQPEPSAPRRLPTPRGRRYRGLRAATVPGRVRLVPPDSRGRSPGATLSAVDEGAAPSGDPPSIDEWRAFGTPRDRTFLQIASPRPSWRRWRRRPTIPPSSRSAPTRRSRRRSASCRSRSPSPSCASLAPRLGPTATCGG